MINFLAIGKGLTLRVSQGQNKTTPEVRKPDITVFSVHNFTTCYLNERPSQTQSAVFSAQPTEMLVVKGEHLQILFLYMA